MTVNNADAQTQGQPTGGNTQGADTSQQQTPQVTQPQQQQTSPYAQYLEKFPETVRPMAEPIFKEWDADVTKRFQQLHSQYSWAEPWQEFAQNYEPDNVSQALQLLQAVSADPEQFYKAFGEAYGYVTQPNAEQGQPGSEDGLVTDPRIDKLQQSVEQLAQFITGNQQQQQEQQEEQEFIGLLTELQQKHGDYDLDYVLAKIAAGADPEQAVLAFRQLSPAAPENPAPVVMGSGGGVPTTSTDLKSLDRKQTQDLVASVLGARQSG